ncbi:secreted protein [Candidatus Magnetomorum sp. HK-1]|nr:secreted protein [Candidatus Magnetomorum sp. HK-1]
MKKTHFFIFLIIGLVTISACSYSKVRISVEIEKSNDESLNKGIMLPFEIVATENTDEIERIGPDQWFKVRHNYSVYSQFENFKQNMNTKDFFIGIDKLKNVKKIIVFANYAQNTNKNDQFVTINLMPGKYCYRIVLEHNKMRLKNEQYSNMNHFTF